MKRFLIIIAVLTLLVPGVLLAQDEITLEGLAEQVTEVVEQVTDLAERIELIESLWKGPGSTDLGDDLCLISLRDTLQDETVMKYKAQYDEWLDPQSTWFVGVTYAKDTGHILITYADDLWGDANKVIEEWNGCEFVGSSDWWEEE